MGYGTRSGNAFTIIFMTAIAYSVLLTTVVSYLVVERVTGLKHLQLISGMQLSSYWVGNMIIDYLKMQVTIFTTIGLFFAFKLDYSAAWVTYLLFPIAALPFTYVTSFLFKYDSAA
jgi:hypothetical protein